MRNEVVATIAVELHPSGMVLSPDGRHLVVANAASDTVSVIDTNSNTVVERIWTKQNPAVLLSASPNALGFDAEGKNLYVCNGTMNSIAVIEFEPGRSELEGLLPVGWFPGALVVDQTRDALYVANIKGIGEGRPNKKSGKAEFNSHQYFGSVSLIPEIKKMDLAKATQTVMDQCRESSVKASLAPCASGSTTPCCPGENG